MPVLYFMLKSVQVIPTENRRKIRGEQPVKPVFSLISYIYEKTCLFGSDFYSVLSKKRSRNICGLHFFILSHDLN